MIGLVSNDVIIINFFGLRLSRIWILKAPPALISWLGTIQTRTYPKWYAYLNCQSSAWMFWVDHNLVKDFHDWLEMVSFLDCCVRSSGRQLYVLTYLVFITFLCRVPKFGGVLLWFDLDWQYFCIFFHLLVGANKQYLHTYINPLRSILQTSV